MRVARLAIVLFGVAAAMSAATTAPSFDYWVFLYQTPGKAEVFVNMGNNAFSGAAPAGPTFNAYMRVTNAAGQEVCAVNDVQAPAIPTGKAWAAYVFRVAYPHLILPLEKGKGSTTYTITASISPENSSSDRDLSNQSKTQTFTLASGGTPSCTKLPRPTFH